MMCAKSTRNQFHAFLETLCFGGNADKEEVRDIISNVADLVVEAKGTQKRFGRIFFPHKHTNKFCQPDWVPLYFKFKTRLSDDARQTLLNLTQLGKSGVSKHYLLHSFMSVGGR